MNASLSNGLAVAGLSVCVGTFHLRDVSLQITRGSYAVLMGPSGSGKTTLLETICGLLPAICGSIHIGGADVTRLPPSRRGIGYVPQDLALFPTLSVRAHLEFAMRIRGYPKSQIQPRSLELADWLGLAALLDRQVDQLSGGESQRVAIGRALAVQPQLLLLDEPLSALDAATRQQLHSMLKHIRSTGVTTLHVTHQRSDAQELADAVFEI